MTMKQIQLMLDRASIREHNEYAAQAALHNKKMKTTRSLEGLQAEETVKHSPADYDKVNAGLSDILKENQTNALKRGSNNQNRS